VTALHTVRRRERASWPWFRRWPAATVGVASALFLGIFVVRVTVGSPEDAVSMLFVLPIALLAVGFGLRGGVVAGLVGTCLIATWAVLDDISFSAIGWASRVTPLLLLGGLLGYAVDRLRRAEDEQLALELAAARQRDAIEINDMIVQGISAAKWALEAGDTDRALAIVEETSRHGHQLVSELLRDADMGPLGDGQATVGERAVNG
jgi:hypothetical protein